MNSKTYKKIIAEFVEKLTERRFLGQEYALYIFSIKPPENNNEYLLSLEAYGSTFKYNKKNGFPIPQKNGLLLNISLKKYQDYAYAYGRGGGIVRFISIVNDHENNGGKPFIEMKQLEYWQDKHVYFCGYEFEDTRLVFFLIFDFEPDKPSQKNGDKRCTEIAERELYEININPILRYVEHQFHKRQIFNEDYLNILAEKINRKEFLSIHESIREISSNYKYNNYLQKIYYDFLIKNFLLYRDKLTPGSQEKLLDLTRKFEKNQRNLFRIPRYRDHFLHQINVYLLGLSIIHIIYGIFNGKLIDDFNQVYFTGGNKEYQTINDISFIWFLAAMFHDIAYPVEKCGDWLDAFFQQYIYRQKDNRPILEARINIANMISDVDYNSCIEELAEYHRKLNFRKGDLNYMAIRNEQSVNKGCEVRTQVLDQIIRHRDHGILAAVMLIHSFRNENEIFRFLFPAVAAISVHNFLWTDKEILHDPCKTCIKYRCEKCMEWKKSYDKYFENMAERNKNRPNRDKVEDLRYISFEKDPMGFLLTLCDLLHDWGRYDLENLKQAFDPYFDPCQLAKIENEDNKIVFEIKIKTKFYGRTKEIRKLLNYKKRQVVQVFSRLKFIKGYDVIIKFVGTKKIETVEFSMNDFSGRS
jgi:hypothetical protein